MIRGMFMLAAFALLTVCGTAFSADEWSTNFAEAEARAKKEKKVMILDFTGSDWCPPCKKLKADIFDSKAFSEWAANKVVLVEVDSPRRKELPAELKKQNDELKKKFSISAFPTVIFLSPDGKILATQKGFGGGDTAAWTKTADEIIKKAN